MATYHRVGSPISQYQHKDITVFTDGSGGRSSSDKRLRRCAWAWVCPRPGTNRDALHGARGALDGKQTVPRAELTAILNCLLDLKGHKTIKNITIYSDCKMAVDGFQRGPAYSKLTACGAIWADICDVIQDLKISHVDVTILKVKSHTEGFCLCKRAINVWTTTLASR